MSGAKVHIRQLWPMSIAATKIWQHRADVAAATSQNSRPVRSLTRKTDAAGAGYGSVCQASSAMWGSTGAMAGISPPSSAASTVWHALRGLGLGLELPQLPMPMAMLKCMRRCLCQCQLPVVLVMAVQRLTAAACKF